MCMPKAELLHCQAWFRYPLRHRVWLPLSSRLQHRRSRNSLIPSMPFRSLLDDGPMALHLFSPWVLDGPERLQVMCIAKAKTKLIGGFKMPITIVIIVIKNNVWHLGPSKTVPTFSNFCEQQAIGGLHQRRAFGKARADVCPRSQRPLGIWGSLTCVGSGQYGYNAPDPNYYIYEVYNHN